MLYLTLFKKSFQRMMAYRIATVAGTGTNFFFGLLRAYVFMAVYQASGGHSIGGLTVRDAVTFTALTQAIGTSLSIIHGQYWTEILDTIRSGEIVSDLTRPYHFLGAWFAKDVGRAVFQLLFRGLPILVVYPFFFDLTWPAGPVQWAAFLLSLCLGLGCSFALRSLVQLSAFWLVDARGMVRLVWLGMTFLSGFLVPIRFFPSWLRQLVMATPLHTIVNTPVEVYLGVLSPQALAGALAVQAAWGVVLAVLCELVYRRGLQRLVIQGG